MNPISIALPVYNGENFLEEAIDSIEAQGYDHYELVVVDNHSSDGTAEILARRSARNPRIRVIRNEQTVSQVENVNRSALNCCHEWIHFFCHDDLMLPGCLQVVDQAIEVASQKSDTVLIGHAPAWLFANDMIHLPGGNLEGSDIFARELIQSNSLVQTFDRAKLIFHQSGCSTRTELKHKLGLYLPALTTAVVRKDAFLQNGMFDPRYVHFDVFAWTNLLLRKSYLHVDIPLTLTRIHGAQVAVDARKSERTITDNKEFWQEFSMQLSGQRKLEIDEKLMLYLKPRSTVAGLISVLIIRGNYREAMSMLLRQNVLDIPVILALLSRSYPKERLRIRALASRVPLHLIYP